ncbi:GTP-binding protein [Clostridium peptidivorans]|uniref:GTP-binding protein n=1 Tax=Clostridium peptidivorans TaxID=100174 RepID=UPI000BE292F2|nr:GTP-binding protein [Clostridium peptidivorans]
MEIKSDIEIVTGVLGSGKTSLINALLNVNLIPKEKVLILQEETGGREIEKRFRQNSNIIIRNISAEEPLTKEYFKYLVNLHHPHRVIIEMDGTKNLEEMLKILNGSEMKKVSKISTIYYVAEAQNFENYLKNKDSFLIPLLTYSNLILLTKCVLLRKGQWENIKLAIEDINPKAFMLRADSMGSIERVLQESHLIDRGILKKLRFKLNKILCI